MTSIRENLQQLNEKIRCAETKAHRIPYSVALLAVSKSQSAEKIKEAFEAGQIAFGENYVQEALKKQVILKQLPVEWHFIGTIQSNKTKFIAQHFDWVHSVASFKIAQRLNAQRSPLKSPLNVCIEINIDQSVTKSGVDVDTVISLANDIREFPQLRLRGFMVIPEPYTDNQQQFLVFQKTAAFYDQMIQQGFALDTLSMGMSSDFESAILAGSTMIRIGSAIFGKRG